MVNDTILNLMIKDHKKIINLINEIENKEHFDIDLFSRFKWQLEKHIFTEEKAIFTSYQVNRKDGDEESRAFDQLSKEHTVILNLIDNIIKETLPSGSLNFSKLKKLLNRHKTFEEQDIYPRLDMKLPKKEKNEIIRKIKEMV